ncbi:ATP-grasp fold amidoligase family protein [Muribaculum sp.]|jgi:hypothetical protein|uniref:ATP-grasp fold amidoligase family protein n=1 Tax=Muribaculum sp. TaxID=1918611 RepID=UPI00257CE2B6|nr:ATP-grasp fold amidoligase family protein [Muribaculum sp.]
MDISSIFRKTAKNTLKLFAPLITNDRWFVATIYRLRMGKSIDMDNPVTFNEKLQWLKVYNRRDGQRKRVDKFAVKEIVGKLIGEQYIIPTLSVWDKPEDIDFDSLPDKFVLKATHGWGGKGVFVCMDKNKFDHKKAIRKLGKCLHKTNYAKLREWPYKGVPARIIAEKYIGPETGEMPTDYKFYCFNGEAKYIMVCIGRVPGSKKPNYYFFDRQWRFCPFNTDNAHYPADFTLPRPQGLDKMLELAGRISQGEPHVRVDFYNVDGHIYFGEITYFSFSGYFHFTPEGNRILGSHISLPEKSYKP